MILTALTANIWRTVAIAALAFAAWQFARVEGFLWIEGWKPRALAAEQQVKAEHTSHRQTVDNYRRAQAEAVARAHTEKAATEARDNARKEKADDNLALAQDRARSAVERYIAGNRCVRAEAAPAAGGSSRGADMPRSTDTASRADRSGGTALVAISERDVNVCSANSLRLQAAHEWANGLVRD